MLSKFLKGPLTTEPNTAQIPESVRRQIEVPEPYAGVTPVEVPARTINQLKTDAAAMVRPVEGDTGIRPPDLAPIEVAPTDTSPALVPRVTLDPMSPESESTVSAVPVPLDPNDAYAMAEQESLRIAEPTISPDFSSPSVAFENITAARNQVQGSIGYGYNDKSFAMKGNDTSLPDEASATNLNYYSDIVKGEIATENGVFGNEAFSNLFESTFNVNEENFETIPSSVMLAGTSVYEDIQSKNYLKSIGADIDADGLFDRRGLSTLSTSDMDKTVGDIRDVVAADPNSQPIIQNLITGYTDKLSAMFSKNSQSPTGSYVKKEVPRELGVGFMMQDFQNGRITFAKNKDGIFYPLLTAKSEQQLNNTLEAAALFDIETRALALKEPLIRAQSFPTINNEFLSKQKMFLNGKYVGKKEGMPLNQVAIQLMDNVALQVDPRMKNLLVQMANIIYGSGLKSLAFNKATGDAVPFDPITNPTGFDQRYYFIIENAYSDSFPAKSIADFSLEKVQDKVKSLLKDNKTIPEIKEIVATLNKNKIDQVDKHLKDYLANQGLRYNTHKISDSTLRIFVTATDTNHGNNSGTIRPAIRFGVRYSARVPNSIGELLPRVKNIANKVYSTANLRGIKNGTTVHARLVNLAEEDLLLLDSIYQIGKVAYKFNLTKIPTNQPTEIDFINSVDKNVLNNMAELGRVYRTYTQGNLPQDPNAIKLPPGFTPKKLFEKKEWADPLSNTIMAADLVDKIQSGGGLVELAATIEHDATQSNAAIMSMLIGDMRVANILKIYLGSDEYMSDREDYKDLRGLVSSSITNDIDLALRGPDEAIKRDAFKRYFNEARSRDGNSLSFDKAYARGIVVAGLYGKSPLYMFTEAETMLQAIGRTDEFIYLESLYNGNTREMLEDISSIYSMSMYNHLNNLKGFQQVVSSIGSVKAIYDGSSEIESFFGTTLSLDYNYATHMDDEQNKRAEIPGLPLEYQSLSGRGSGLTAPRDVNASMSDRSETVDRLAETNEDIASDEDKLVNVSSYGGKAAIALPVVLIQSGDSAQNSATVVYMNQGRDGVPLNYYSTHDAQHTAPGSTLISLNAYNNITPYLLAQDSKNLFDSLYDSMQQDKDKAFKDIKKAGGEANIGLRGKYKAVTGVLDTMFVNSKMVSRDVKRNRGPVTKELGEYFKKRDAFYDKILSLATELGYLPPTKRNEIKRNNIKIDLETFKELTRLIEASKGLLKPKELLPEGLGEVPNAKNFAISKTKKLNEFQNKNEIMLANMASNNNRFYNSK